jgi:hypothetical protein
MPKKTFLIKNFNTGLVGADHGADLPETSMLEGGNINVNRNLGVVELSGSYKDAYRTDDVNADGTSAIFHAPLNHIGFPGRGIFYFTSDYNNLAAPLKNVSNADNFDADAKYNWFPPAIGNVQPFKFSTDKRYGIGEKSDDKPTEYFIVATKHPRSLLGANANAIWTAASFFDSPGLIGTSFHIYERSRSTNMDLYGNNGVSGDGKYNGWLYDAWIGTSTPFGSLWDDYFDETNPTYSEGWFPVYYIANGSIRISDGGFLPQNTAKMLISYMRDSTLYSGLTKTKDDVDLSAGIEAVKVDNWVADKGDNGLLNKPNVVWGSSWDWFYYMTATNVAGIVNTAIDVYNDENGTGLTDLEDCVFFMSPGTSQNQTGESHSAVGQIDDWETFGASWTTDMPHKDGTVICSVACKGPSITEGLELDDRSVAGIQIAWGESESGESLFDVYFSYVYDNGEESTLTKVGRGHAWDWTDFEGGKFTVSNGFGWKGPDFGPGVNLEFYWSVDPARRRANPRIKGIRCYIKNNKSAQNIDGSISIDEYNLVSEMSYELGARSPGSSSWEDWYPEPLYREGGSLSSPPYPARQERFACKSECAIFSETFYSLHGYNPESIKPCYFKTALVVNNRTYVGNVKFDGKLYPDRMMKTQIGEYDTFTENGFIDVAVDDGDSIVHLESFADRILQYKENTVHIINIQKEFEFLETSIKYAGISNPSQVISTDMGIFWANRQGLWQYNGEQVVNLLVNRKNISNKSLRVTNGVISDVLDQWQNVFVDDKDEAPVLSYDPINKDVIVMTQLKYEPNRMKADLEPDDSGILYVLHDLDNDGDIDIQDNVIGTDSIKTCFLNNDISQWEAYSGGANNPTVAADAGNKAMKITTTSHTQNQGAKLAFSKLRGNLGDLVVGETYRITLDLKAASTPNFKVILGQTVSDLTAVDGSSKKGAALSNTFTTYQADVVIADFTDNDDDLIIYNPSSSSVYNIYVRNVSVKKAPKSKDDIAFIWNTEKGNLVQLFHKGERTQKSNSIVTVNGDSMFMANSLFHFAEGYDSEQNGYIGVDERSRFKIWDRDAVADSKRDKQNLFLMTKSIDFENHALRKVVSSIHFTYKSTGPNYLVPFIKAYFLDGAAPFTYYMCQSDAGSVAATALDDETWNGLLPTTSGNYETYKYKNVLSLGTNGTPVSMRSKIKNVGAIQIGLAKFYIDGNIASDFSLEEISITYRDKSPK